MFVCVLALVFLQYRRDGEGEDAEEEDGPFQ